MSEAYYSMGAAVFKFDFVIMPGDNLYGSENPKDYRSKFEEPYKPLLDAGVDFYAALGNHDKPQQSLYKNFHMNGERYYSFDKGNVTLLALDSTYMSPARTAPNREKIPEQGGRELPYPNPPDRKRAVS